MVEINGIEFPYADDKYHNPAWVPKVIGKPVATYDAYEKVTGKAQYSGDIFLPHMLHAKILRAPIAHANIKSIDTRKAESLLGVKAVVTYKDRLDQDAMELGGYTMRYLVNKVRMWGDPVAAVAAETEEIAEDALDLIEVDYEELPFILEYDEALKPGAPIVNEKLFPGNIALDKTWERGDPEAGLKEADRIFEIQTSAGQPSMLQPELHCAVAKYEGGLLTITQPSQGLVRITEQLSPALQIPLHKIVGIANYSGGGYGSSIKQAWHGPVAALLAMKTGRTVRLQEEVERETIQGSRTINTTNLKIGVKNDGTITAIDCTAYVDTGAYGYTSIIAFTADATLGLYTCENERFRGVGVITNRAAGSEYRGFGGPEAWPFEVLIDQICAEMGFDPLEFRKRNSPRQFEKTSCRGGFYPLSSTGQIEIISKLSEKIGWATKWSPPGTKTSAKRMGIGIGIGCRSVGFNWSEVLLKLNIDGGINMVVAGGGNAGMAVHTSQAQIVAEVLDLPIDKIKPSWGSTSFEPMQSGSWGSRTAVNTGLASRRAAEALLQKLFEIAAPKLQVSTEELEAIDGNIRVKGKPETAIPYQKLVPTVNDCIYVVGESLPNILSYGRILSFQTQSGTAYEAEVDTETGGVNILRKACSVDAGRSLNINIVEGQILGGEVTGIGESTMCDTYYDPATGVVLNTSHLDCMYPTAADIPPTEPITVESIDPFTSFGQKGIGEPVVHGQQSAIINTIANATGVWITHLPTTPDVILKALGKL